MADTVDGFAGPPSFDAFTLAAVAAELRETIVGARVQKVQQPVSYEVVLTLYGGGGVGTQRVLLSADPQRFRVHLTQQRRENPITPPAFCQVCRKYLEGAFLDAVTMPVFDRLAHLVFRAHDGERVVLVLELMGRNANVILLSGADIVRGALRPSPPASVRPLRPGTPYQPPPGLGDRHDALTVTTPDAPVFAGLPPVSPEADPERWLAATFSGVGKFAAHEVIYRSAEAATNPAAAFTALMDDVRAGRFAPHSIVSADDAATIGVWAFEPHSVPPGRRFPRETMSIALDTFFASHEARAAGNTEKVQLARVLAREIVYREREYQSAQKTLSEASRADTYERIGNILLANLGVLPRGAAEVTLPDLYAADATATVCVVLDPKRSPHENAEGYFDRARKARDAAAYADGRAADMEDELVKLRALAADLDDTGESIADLSLLRDALSEIVGAARAETVAPANREADSAKRRAPEKPWGGHKVRKYTVDDYELLVGETAEANDYLTTRVASATDIWMHVRSATGAHGILRTKGQPVDRVPDTVVRRAAGIVAARSGTAVKHADLVAVDVVEKRYVRKPRGAKPGMVTYVRERTLDISPSL